MYKKELKFEKYLILLPAHLRNSFIHFRTLNHKLPIEKGRHLDIPRAERKCELCNRIGDEFHFLFECPNFRLDRKHFLNKSFQSTVNADNYCKLFSTTNLKTLCKLANFVKNIMYEFR